MQAEWDHHEAVWLAWPSHRELWGDALGDVQAAFVQLCEGILNIGADGMPRGESLQILVRTGDYAEQAHKILSKLPHTFLHPIEYGDIWLRDTAPLFVRQTKTPTPALAAVCFRFNGWGGKYVLEHDDAVNFAIAKSSRMPTVIREFVLEGGSIEVDGEGTVLTTRQCLLNPNRNPGMAQAAIENELKMVGAQKVWWVTEGLLNDHTDGHIDTIARFVAPGVVVAMEPGSPDDPNAKVLEQILDELRAMTDAKGRTLDVITMPSPGKIVDDDGAIMPASYVNFYIANTSVIVPQYGCANDEAALRAVEGMFPTRKIVGVGARKLLAGGGSFHCISQQQPSV